MSDYSVSTTYPTVIRTADPLLIRLTEHALQVGDIVYRANIKFGITYCGFYVYQNCTGYPVYMEKDEALTASWARSGNSASTAIQTQEEVKEALELKAKEWIDSLEEAIATKRSDNEIKKSIDRLCWQLHYDITESSTNFVEQFQDFSDVDIDRPFDTLYQTLSGIGNTISTGANNIVGSASTGSGLYGVEDKINSLTTQLTGENGAINTYIGKKLCEVSSGTVVGDTVVGALKKVATNLKADNDAYTISRALREDNQESVSGATYQQTQLEQEHFTEVSVNQLGAFGTGASGEAGHRTLFSTIGSYALDGNDTVAQAVGQTIDDGNSSSLTGRVEKIKITIGDSSSGLVKSVDDANSTLSNVSGTVSTISNTVSTIDGNVSTINNKIGTPDNANWTLFNYEHTNKTTVDAIKTSTDKLYCARGNIGTLVNDMYNGMWGDGGSHYGFIMDSGAGTYCVKAAASRGGIDW